MSDGSGQPLSPAEAELRAGVRWVAGGKGGTPDKNVFEWLWEAIQGDFNDERTTGQIAFDAAVSMVPVVDQICDIRDLVANCRSISQAKESEDNTWKYVCLALTLIGLFPALGSLLKGVLKLFFVFIRRYGLDHVAKATDDAMTWVITFLRKREVQRYLPTKRIDEVFGWLAEEVRALRGKVNVSSLLAAFDKAIGILKDLLGKVDWLPGPVGNKARATIKMVEEVRANANAGLGKALKPLQNVLDAFIKRLELERLAARHGIVDARNIHFRGALPDAAAIRLMRTAEPKPKWLTRPKTDPFPSLDPDDDKLKRMVASSTKNGWPSPGKIDRFANIAAHEIKGPARLYRIVSPANMSTGDCWISEEVYKRLQSSKDPRAAWREYLAVWPHWNQNGQFVTYDIPAGESLKVWRGTASTQVEKKMPDASLNGGWEQIVFDPATKAAKYDMADTATYFQIDRATGKLTETALTRGEYDALSELEKVNYEVLRREIKNPNISGPFETGWDYTDFKSQDFLSRIGLPALPGQTTQLAK